MLDQADAGRVLFDMVDVDSDKWRQYALSSRAPLSWIYRREAGALELLERQAAQGFWQNAAGLTL